MILVHIREMLLRRKMDRLWGKPYAVSWLGTGGGFVQIWDRSWAEPSEFKGRTVIDALRAAIEHKDKP
jgi:hypothetical protein